MRQGAEPRISVLIGKRSPGAEPHLSGLSLAPRKLLEGVSVVRVVRVEVRTRGAWVTGARVTGVWVTGVWVTGVVGHGGVGHEGHRSRGVGHRGRGSRAVGHGGHRSPGVGHERREEWEEMRRLGTSRRQPLPLRATRPPEAQPEALGCSLPSAPRQTLAGPELPV